MKDKIEICKSTVIHEDIIKKIKGKQEDDTIIIDLSEFFKVFGDSTRIKILQALTINEMCVCDISNLLSMTQSAISHQLKILRMSRLVKYRKEGKVVYYSLEDKHVKDIIKIGLQHIKEN